MAQQQEDGAPLNDQEAMELYENMSQVILDKFITDLRKIYDPFLTVWTRDTINKCETENDKKAEEGRMKNVIKQSDQILKQVLNKSELPRIILNVEQTAMKYGIKKWSDIEDNFLVAGNNIDLIQKLCVKFQCSPDMLEAASEKTCEVLENVATTLQCTNSEIILCIEKLKSQLQVTLSEEQANSLLHDPEDEGILDKERHVTEEIIQNEKTAYRDQASSKSLKQEALPYLNRKDESSYVYQGMNFNPFDGRASEMLLNALIAQNISEVKPFAKGNKSEWKLFLDSFELKYPKTTYPDDVRKVIFVSKLKGLSKERYDSLLEKVREGPLVGIVEGLTRLSAGDRVQNRMEAFEAFINLKLTENMSLVEFCKRLEETSRIAFPDIAEHQLSISRANVLYKAKADCHCNMQILEVIEEMEASKLSGVYDKVKEIALRCERNRKLIDISNEYAYPRLKSANKLQYSNKDTGPFQIRRSNKVHGENYFSKERETVKTKLNTKQKCFYCGKEGHTVSTCFKREREQKENLGNKLLDTKDNNNKSNVSSNITRWNRSITLQQNKNINATPLYGLETIVDVVICGKVKRKAVVDTGSQVSVISTQLLANLMEKEKVDVDSEIVEIPFDNSEYIANASGNRMQFLAAITCNVEVSKNRKNARVSFLVSKSKEEILLLGTNAIPILNIGLNFFDKREAIAMRRIFLQANESKWMPISCGKDSVGLLSSKRVEVASGLCKSESGLTQVLAVNSSEKPCVIKKGDIIGLWELPGWQTWETVEFSEEDINNKIHVREIKMLDEFSKATDSSTKRSKVVKVLSEQSNISFAPEWTSLIEDYVDIFALVDADLTQTNICEMEIETGDALPIKQKARPVPFGVREQFRNILGDLLKRNIIEPSNSAWASPIVLVEKKDKSIRLCIDYRELNKILKLDAYPLPSVDIMLRSLKGKRIFSTFDLSSGFWQIRLSEKDKEKTSFVTSEGSFQFLVCPFGLATSPPTFQRMMDKALGKLLQTEEVFVYIDDILIATENVERHFEVTRLVFNALREANLSLKASKSKLLQTELAYLGHVISHEGVHADPSKISALKDYPRPETIAQLRTFLGMCSYYRKFVFKFATIAKPLHQMTSEKSKFEWTRDRIEAFERLKETLVKAPILAQPNFQGAMDGSKPFIIYTDACGTGVGAVLSQEGTDKFLHPISFSSKGLTKAESNYHITDLEALALVFSLEKFQPFIYNMKNTIIRTDHQPLVSLFKKNLSGRLLRWSMIVQRYNIVIEYVKGSANVIADALSRGTLAENIGTDSINHERLGSKYICSITVKNSNIHELQKDKNYASILEKLKTSSLDQRVFLPRCPFKLHAGDFVIENENLYYNDSQGRMRKVIPESKRKLLYAEVHEGLFGAHFGVNKIIRKLAKEVFWEGMTSDVTLWHKKCKSCFINNQKNIFIPPLKPVRTEKPFEIVGIDIMELGLTTSGNRYVVTVIDHFSKWAAAYPIQDKKATTVADIIVSRWICEGGKWPKQFLSDQGSEFVNSVTEEMRKITGIDWITTLGYNPRENGITERMNRTIQSGLRKSGVTPTEWDKLLPFILYAYNTTPHESTGESPFFLLHGIEPCLVSNIVEPPKPTLNDFEINEYRLNFLEGLRAARSFAIERNDKERERYKSYYDNNNMKPLGKKPLVGERVYMKLPGEKRAGSHAKLRSDFQGPFRILENYETSALITDISGKKEPIVIQYDLLMRVPESIDDEPLKTKKNRKNIKLRKNLTIKPSDACHPLYECSGIFQASTECHEKCEWKAKTYGDVMGERCPTMLRGIRITNTFRLAQFLTILNEPRIWYEDKLAAINRAAIRPTAEYLADAILYQQKFCAHARIHFALLSNYHVTCTECPNFNMTSDEASKAFLIATEKIQREPKNQRRDILFVPQRMNAVNDINFPFGDCVVYQSLKDDVLPRLFSVKDVRYILLVLPLLSDFSEIREIVLSLGRLGCALEAQVILLSPPARFDDTKFFESMRLWQTATEQFKTERQRVGAVNWLQYIGCRGDDIMLVTHYWFAGGAICYNKSTDLLLYETVKSYFWMLQKCLLRLGVASMLNRMEKTRKPAYLKPNFQAHSTPKNKHTIHKVKHNNSFKRKQY